jgi:hypothetical protein
MPTINEIHNSALREKATFLSQLPSFRSTETEYFRSLILSLFLSGIYLTQVQYHSAQYHKLKIDRLFNKYDF